MTISIHSRPAETEIGPWIWQQIADRIASLSAAGMELEAAHHLATAETENALHNPHREAQAREDRWRRVALKLGRSMGLSDRQIEDAAEQERAA